MLTLGEEAEEGAEEEAEEDEDEDEEGGAPPDTEVGRGAIERDRPVEEAGGSEDSDGSPLPIDGCMRDAAAAAMLKVSLGADELPSIVGGFALEAWS
mgnify:CR=1 FL=1